MVSGFGMPGCGMAISEDVTRVLAAKFAVMRPHLGERQWRLYLGSEGRGELVEDSTRGDPMSPLRWTTKSAENLAGELTRQGHRCRKDAVLRVLHQQGYSTQGN